METEERNQQPTKPDEKPVCKHCGVELKRVGLPPEAGYDAGFFWVCFNDDCPFFIRGWRRMNENYEARASYRYRIDPATGGEGSMPVWSKNAMKDRIF